jgi:hypothetical protein
MIPMRDGRPLNESELNLAARGDMPDRDDVTLMPPTVAATVTALTLLEQTLAGS